MAEQQPEMLWRLSSLISRERSFAWFVSHRPSGFDFPPPPRLVGNEVLTAGQRPVSITSPRGTQTIQWEPNKGRIQSVSTPEGVSLSYLYDGPLVTRTTWSGGGISGRVDRAYDDDLRLRTISVNGANAVTYAYDADSLLRQAGSLVLNRDPETGLLSGTALGNVTTAYTYNGFGELASMTSSFGATALYSEAYTRDALGRIVTRVETIQGITTTWEYGYDAAGRLETVTKNGLVAAQYAYDANGNRLVKQTPTVYETGTYDAQDRMLTYAGASYTYTANGETLTKTDATGTTSYQYDVFGNLLGVDLPNGTQIRYKVDGRNRRVERSVNGVVTQRWLWQGQLSPIAELNASNAVVSRFVYATRVNVPDYMIKGGVTYRILHDHLGSPRLVVNTSTGAIAQRMDFDEWGIVTTDTNPGWQPFGFAGGLYEPSSALVRFGVRDFSGTFGRWLSKDQSRFSAGDLNIFGYSYGDPANVVDLNGKVPLAVAAAALSPAAPYVLTALAVSAVLAQPGVRDWIYDQVHEIAESLAKIPPLLKPDPRAPELTDPYGYVPPRSYPAAPGRRGPGTAPVCRPTPDAPFPEVASRDDPQQPLSPEEVFEKSLDQRRKKLLDALGEGLGEESDRLGLEDGVPGD
jgi:RHS repeat-associated protein